MSLLASCASGALIQTNRRITASPGSQGTTECAAPRDTGAELRPLALARDRALPACSGHPAIVPSNGRSSHALQQRVLEVAVTKSQIRPGLLSGSVSPPPCVSLHADPVPAPSRRPRVHGTQTPPTLSLCDRGPKFAYCSVSLSHSATHSRRRPHVCAVPRGRLVQPLMAASARAGAGRARKAESPSTLLQALCPKEG